jgi:hypothetical protein
MKMCGEWNNISANFYLGTVWRRVNSSIWGEEPPVIIAYEVEYVPEPVWTLWRRENSPCRETNTARPGNSPLL